MRNGRKRRTIWTSVLVSSVTLLSGCAMYTPVTSGLHRTGPYSLETAIDWSKRKGKPVVWTVDGESLEFMLHFEGVGDGERLFAGLPDEQADVFDVGMNSTDVISAFIASFELAHGARALETTKIAPAPFGPWQGFRFEFNFESSSGVPMRAISIGAIANDRLHLLVYAGARDYYFDKYEHFVEQMFDSISVH